jgi:ABC-2 type transport system permease protein
MTSSSRAGHHPAVGPAVLQAAGLGLLKLRSVRSTWVLALSAVAMSAMSAVIQFTVAGAGAPIALLPAEAADRLHRATTLTPLFVLILTILATAGEFRHRTISSTLLLNPRRTVWLAGQTAASAIIGVLVCLSVYLATAALGAALAALHGTAMIPTVTRFIPTIVGLLVVTGAYAVLGTGVAAAIGDQTIAIVAVLGWNLILELLLAGAFPTAAPYLPGRLAATLLTVTDRPGPSPGWSMILLYGYALAAALAGAARLYRRDIAA